VICMSDEDVLDEAIENLIGEDVETDVGLEDLDLPRIVVEKDSIVVFEEDWVERNVDALLGDGNDEEDDANEMLERIAFLPERKIAEEDRKDVSELEEVVGFSEKRSDGYRVSEVKDSYDLGKYEGVGGGDKIEDVSYVKVEVEVERVEDRWGKRSMLEVAGFRDEEAEKKRKEKRGASY